MANKLYPKGRQAFLDGDIDFSADTIKAVLVTSAYTQNDAHDNLDDVTGGARVATATLASKTSTDGTADAADVTYTAVAAGSTVVGIVLYKDTGTESTSKLIAWFDTKADTTAINVVTNGGDIVITWHASGIFTL